MEHGAFFALQREVIEERLRLTFSRGPRVKERLAELDRAISEFEYTGAVSGESLRVMGAAPGEGE
jgi:hypothetical protein